MDMTDAIVLGMALFGDGGGGGGPQRCPRADFTGVGSTDIGYEFEGIVEVE